MKKETIIEHKKEAITVTGIVLVLIFLFFMFRAFSAVPKMEVNEGGVEVQLGEPDQGGPDNSPMTESDAYTPPTEASADDLVDSEDSEVSVKTSDSKKQEVKEPEKKEPEKKVDQTITDLMNKKKNSKDKSAGVGDGKAPGTQGDKKGEGDKTKGTPGKGGGDNNSIGTPNGLIAGLSLSGRNITKKPVLRDSYNSKGKVVVEILVNAKGNVVSATAGARGTTVNDPKLFAIAKKLALETKFDALSSGKSQNGTITFKFGLK